MAGKKHLNEQQIREQYVDPELERVGWKLDVNLGVEVRLTPGAVIVQGRGSIRGEERRADYVLYSGSGLPLAIVEAKDNKHSVRAGMQQALAYAEMIDAPFAYSTNGDAFFEHDRTRVQGPIEQEIPLTAFPTPDELWRRYAAWKGLSGAVARAVEQPYHEDAGGRTPRYYQTRAINRAVEAIAGGQPRALLVMATGTGKTYVAFQIIWRLWKAKLKKRILFLADRNVLIDQAQQNDFKHFGGGDDEDREPPDQQGVRGLPRALPGHHRQRRREGRVQAVLPGLLRSDHRRRVPPRGAPRPTRRGAMCSIISPPRPSSGSPRRPRRRRTSRPRTTSARRWTPTRSSRASRTGSSRLTR